MRELTVRVAASSLGQADEILSEKTQLLNAKLENLVRVLDMEGDEKTDGMSEKQEKEMNNQIEKERNKAENTVVLSRANSLKRAVKQLAEYTEQVVENQTRLPTPNSGSSSLEVPSYQQTKVS